MRFVFLLCSFISNISYADTVTLKIDLWSDFFSASGRTFIQGGTLVDVKDLDLSKPICSSRGYGINNDSVTGNLTFFDENSKFHAHFDFQGESGNFLYLRCTSHHALGLRELNDTLNPIASLK